MRFFRLHSIKSQLALVVLAASLPGLFFAIYTPFEAYRRAVSAAEQDLLRAIDVIREIEGRFIATTGAMLKAVTAFSASLPRDSDGCSVLRDVVNDNPAWNNIAIVDPNGTINCMALDASGSVAVGDRPYFQKALKQRDVVVGTYLIDRISKRPILPLAYASRADDGAPESVTVISIDLRWLQGVLDTIISASFADYSVTVFDAQYRIFFEHSSQPASPGAILPEMERPPSLPSGEGVVMMRGEDRSGSNRIFVVGRLAGDGASPVFLRLSVPRESVDQPSLSLAFYTVLPIGLFIILMVGLATVSAHFSIVRPVRNLGSTARRIAGGDFEARSDDALPRSEIGELRTHFNAMAEALQNHASLLEDRVQERTAELEATNKELAAFSYSVSHDLRAPLRAIDGFSRALLEFHQEDLPPEARKFLSRIRAAAQRMATLIDDLLALSRVTRIEMKVEPVDISALARSIFDELCEGDSSRKVSVHVQPGILVHGDPTLLKVALSNLIENAWKFTSKTEDAQIGVSATETDDEVIVTVTDNGAGFSMKYADKLFGAFQRLHSDAEFAGTGVGLATVMRVVNRHRGRAWASAEVGRGAIFHLAFPKP